MASGTRPLISKLLLAAAIITFSCNSLFVGETEAANILGILPTWAKSHYIIGAEYLRVLALAGHNVTVVTPFRLGDSPPNYHEIVMDGILDASAGLEKNYFKYKDGSFLMILSMLYNDLADTTCRFVLKHPKVVTLMKSDQQFDVVIVETFMTESIYGLAQHFNAPLVVFSTLGSNLWTNGLVGAPSPYSHMAHLMLGFTDHMNFYERMINTVVGVGEQVYYELVYLPRQKRFYDEAFSHASMSFDQQLKNTSLVLLNQHFALSSPRSYPPNMVEVGGTHIRDVRPLPEDLQQYLDEAPDGVIYFCMGSHIQSKHFPSDKRDAFLKVFSQLKQRVLWKFEDTSIPDIPSNVLIRSWMPQNDILAHRNVKLFITHGGLLGTTEALYHGKPIVGIPIFGDQLMNVQKAVRSGYGLKLDYELINEASVREVIETVLMNESFTERAREISGWYHDKPMTAAETAIFWTEYVIRHRGAAQLRSPAVELKSWQYYLLDVGAVLVGLCLFVFAMIYKCLGAIRTILDKVNKYKRD
ncbi:AAEL003098-PA [Aedes aegypti]|uniref:UDP-glucuronosyltransferase n=1 Tax=Aedes aegypti TaxID=7159 RepID=Q17GE4_AEDAE|nr:AAEL003098-PA [Aedes aegypti]